MDPLFISTPSEGEIGEALRHWPELAGKRVRPLLEVTYVLGGFDLDPSAVTAATLLEPTGVTLRGMSISPSSPLKPKASFWEIRIWRERQWEIESTVRELLAILAPAASQLRAFADRYEATVSVVVDPVEGSPGLYLGPDLIRTMADLGVGIEIVVHINFPPGGIPSARPSR